MNKSDEICMGLFDLEFGTRLCDLLEDVLSKGRTAGS